MAEHGVTELITGEERSRLAPLFPDNDDTLMTACLHGHRGRAAISNNGNSGVLLSGDFAFLGGTADDALLRWLVAVKPGYVILSGDEHWLTACQTIGREWQWATRFAFKTPQQFDESRLQAMISEALPAGFVLRSMDEHAFAQCRENVYLCDLCSAFGSMADFEAHGIGILAEKDGAIVAGASTYAWDDDAIEVEIDTLPAFRRMGLATACGAALLHACQKLGIRAHWDAANDASARLARKLGYPAPVPYEVIEWP